jgi:hypothetical protein
MIRKISLVCAVAAAVLFPMPTFAGHGHGHGHWRGHGHGGHWWHGRYWGYGVGSCWRWTPAGYIWICGY